MIQKQTRREYVAAVEEKLKQHPLAMYPHYKDHMSPEVSGGDSSLDYQAVMCQNNEASISYNTFTQCLHFSAVI